MPLDGLHVQPPEQVRVAAQPPSAYLPATHVSHVVLLASPFVLVPAAQSLQTTAPMPPYFPGAQSVQTPAPAPAYLPATHAVHAQLSPMLFVLVPAAQSVHTDAPVTAANFPGAHPLQRAACPVAENFPGTQTHASACALAVGDVLFGGHRMHDAEPDVFLYVPVAHAPHAAVEPPRPVYPAVQTQDATVCAPPEEEVSVGHAEQFAAPASAYVPAEQLLQGALPLTALYVPATQDVHTPPSRPVYATLHVQSVTAAFWPRVCAFAGHCQHAVAPEKFVYFPLVQASHVVARAALENLPTAQGSHALLTATENLPATQSTHVVAPVSFVYFPGTHSAHVVLPADADIFPDTHGAHGSAGAPVPYVPASQLEHDAAPGPENLPSRHGVHCSFPTVPLYVPAAHAVQQGLLPASPHH